MSVHQQVLSINNSLDRRDGYVGIILSVRRQFHDFLFVDTFCPSTIPGGNVTEIDRQRERQTERETDANKGLQALGGNPPKSLEPLRLGFGRVCLTPLCSI